MNYIYNRNTSKKYSLVLFFVKGLQKCSPFFVFIWYSAESQALIPYYPPLYTHHHFHLTLVNSIGYSYLRCKFNRVAKRKIKHVPKYLQDNKKALKAISWAFRSDLRAYPVPSGNEYHIVIENGLKRIKSPYTYKNVELTEKLWDIYIYYYDKHLEKVGYES